MLDGSFVDVALNFQTDCLLFGIEAAAVQVREIV
jgi:hypothetical protein